MVKVEGEGDGEYVEILYRHMCENRTEPDKNCF
jgi:hypothetical protein